MLHEGLETDPQTPSGLIQVKGGAVAHTAAQTISEDVCSTPVETIGLPSDDHSNDRTPPGDLYQIAGGHWCGPRLVLWKVEEVCVSYRIMLVDDLIDELLAARVPLVDQSARQRRGGRITGRNRRSLAFVEDRIVMGADIEVEVDSEEALFTCVDG